MITYLPCVPAIVVSQLNAVKFLTNGTATLNGVMDIDVVGDYAYLANYYMPLV